MGLVLYLVVEGAQVEVLVAVLPGMESDQDQVSYPVLWYCSAH
jgi:hypothetical protein